MAKVIISLLGGRPLTNVLAALYLNPDCLYVVASEDSCTPDGNYDKFNLALPDRLKPQKLYTVKPYKLQEVLDKCEEITDQHLNDQITIVSASEPKPMSFGAYDFVKNSRERGRNIDMCYVSREGLVWVLRDEIEPVKIDLKSYFLSYGWNIEMEQIEDERLEKLISLLIGQIEISHSLLRELRSSDKGKGKRTNKSKLRNSKESILLKEIEKVGIVSNLLFNHDNVRWTISDDGAQLLLTGVWLEFYIYQVASQLKDAQGKPLFDECGWRIKDKSGKGEIDFVGIIGGQIVIASCKTEGELKRAWFEELHSKMEQLGKGMCSGLLISSASRKDKSMVDLDKWAKERQIILVTAEDLSRLPDILKKVVIGDINAEPKDIPCYPRI